MPWKKHQPAIDLELTDRQQEVLGLIARGRTNPEIATELGITLDGAKWHVREILSKLGVESREEAANYWRAHQRPGRRLVRILGGMASPGLFKGAAAAIGVGSAAAMTIVVIAVLDRDSEPSASEATPTVALAPSASPRDLGPTPAVVEILDPFVQMLPGMFFDPQPSPVVDVELSAPPVPDPTFAWDGESTMIYDRETGELIDLGPGEPAAFSPDGEWAVWVSVNRFEGDLHAINLRTGERKDLGEGGYVSHFLDDDRFFLDVDSTRYAVSIATGARELVAPSSLPVPPLDATSEYRLDSKDTAIPFANHFTVTRNDGAVVAEFHARSAFFAQPTELVVQSIPIYGVTNLFLVDLVTLVPEFVATIPFDVQHGQFSATATHVVWNPDVCAEPGETFIRNRATGTIGRMDRGLLPWAYKSPPGLIAEGLTGLQRLLDLETNQYVFVSPAGWPRWSEDYRYVSVGYVGGHGSFCVTG